MAYTKNWYPSNIDAIDAMDSAENLINNLPPWLTPMQAALIFIAFAQNRKPTEIYTISYDYSE